MVRAREGPDGRRVLLLGGLAVVGVALALASIEPARFLASQAVETAGITLGTTQGWLEPPRIDPFAMGASLGAAVVAFGMLGYGIHQVGSHGHYGRTDRPDDRSSDFQFGPHTDGDPRSDRTTIQPTITGVGWDAGFVAEVPLRRWPMADAVRGDFLRSSADDRGTDSPVGSRASPDPDARVDRSTPGDSHLSGIFDNA